VLLSRLWQLIRYWLIIHNSILGGLITSSYSYPKQNQKNIIFVIKLVTTPLWRSVRMTFTFLKWGLGNPLGLLKTQSSITKVKTPRLEVFFIPLENSQGGLQVCFRPHPNWRSEQGIMNFQSPRSSNRDNFETPLWESREKVPFRCRCCGVMQIILYGGRWWLPRSLGRGESCESRVTRGLS
jgi:hypothetical protein